MRIFLLKILLISLVACTTSPITRKNGIYYSPGNEFTVELPFRPLKKQTAMSPQFAPDSFIARPSRPASIRETSTPRLIAVDFFNNSSNKRDRLVFSIEWLKAKENPTKDIDFYSYWEKWAPTYLKVNFGTFGHYNITKIQRIEVNGYSALAYAGIGNHNAPNRPAGSIYAVTFNFESHIATAYMLVNYHIDKNLDFQSLPMYTEFEKFYNSLTPQLTTESNNMEE